MIRIGKVSKILNISVQTIRYYEKYGLIKPDHVCPETGYRYFNASTLDELWNINILKSAGFTLAEIKNMENKHLNFIGDMLKEKRNELIADIEKKQFALSYLTSHITALDNLDDIKFYEGVIKTFDARCGIKIETDITQSIEDHFSSLSSVDVIHDLNQEVLYQPSRYISLKNNQSHLKFLFALFDKPIDMNEYTLKNITSIPGGPFYCQKVRGLRNKSDFYLKLKETINSSGYQLRGDALELLIIDSTLSKNPSDRLIEVQVGLTKK